MVSCTVLRSLGPFYLYGQIVREYERDIEAPTEFLGRSLFLPEAPPGNGEAECGDNDRWPMDLLLTIASAEFSGVPCRVTSENCADRTNQ